MHSKSKRTPLTCIVATLYWLLFALATTTVYAQQDDAEEEEAVYDEILEEMIVTGTRVPRSVDKIPGAINIITPEEISRTINLTSDITALLSRTIPGYSESNQQLDSGGEKLRGRTPLRLLDGIPQGSPLRSVNRNAVFSDMGIIERVEVINGPSSTEGIGASGGIINYITKRATEDGTELQASFQYRTQFENDSESYRGGFNVAHKTGAFDMLLAAAKSEDGLAYDANGRPIGISASGTAMDSRSSTFFGKMGYTFGSSNQQRIEASYTDFRLDSQSNYSGVLGDRDLNITNTVVKERPPTGQSSFNDFSQYSITYTNDDLFEGTLWIQYYGAKQLMAFSVNNSNGRQDPLIAEIPLGPDGLPLGEFPLFDQSQVKSVKEGLRTSWSREFSNSLLLQVGLDFVEDAASQDLVLTNRLWMPPVIYSATAPFLQLGYDIGPVTVTGGIRHENGQLKVNDYTTIWTSDRRNVGGGKLDYKETMYNFGAIWNIDDEWSIFVSYAQGFTLPSVGSSLRSISCTNDTTENGLAIDGVNVLPYGGTQPDGCPNDPPISIDGIIDLEAVLVTNKEIGFNWRGSRGRFGASYYESDSPLGEATQRDENFVLRQRRRPTEIKGWEVNAALNATDDIEISWIFSHTEGRTRKADEGPLDLDMGISDIGPDKSVLTANWTFSERGQAIVGMRTMFDMDINEGLSSEGHVENYTLFDLIFNYQIGLGTFTLGVENLLDKYYIPAYSQINVWQNFQAGRGRELTFGYTMTF
jgi:iron complex outermembrane receptor protein